METPPEAGKTKTTNRRKEESTIKENNETHMLSVDAFILFMESLVCSSCSLVVSNTVSAPDVQLGAVDDVFVGHAFLRGIKSGGLGLLRCICCWRRSNDVKLYIASTLMFSLKIFNVK